MQGKRNGTRHSIWCHQEVILNPVEAENSGITLTNVSENPESLRSGESYLRGPCFIQRSDASKDMLGLRIYPETKLTCRVTFLCACVCLFPSFFLTERPSHRRPLSLGILPGAPRVCVLAPWLHVDEHAHLPGGPRVLVRTGVKST